MTIMIRRNKNPFSVIGFPRILRLYNKQERTTYDGRIPFFAECRYAGRIGNPGGMGYIGGGNLTKKKLRGRGGKDGSVEWAGPTAFYLLSFPAPRTCRRRFSRP